MREKTCSVSTRSRLTCPDGPRGHGRGTPPAPARRPRRSCARTRGVLPHRGSQPQGKPDGEHRPVIRDLDPARLRRPGQVTAGLPLRAAQLPGQHPGRLRRRNPCIQQGRGSVDMRRVLGGTRTADPRHDTKLLQITSNSRQMTAACPASPLTATAPLPPTARSTMRSSPASRYPAPQPPRDPPVPRRPAQRRPARPPGPRPAPPAPEPARIGLQRPRRHPGAHRPRSTRR